MESKASLTSLALSNARSIKGGFSTAPAEKIEMHSPKYFYACTVGGILSCGLTHGGITPLDLVKCRMQTGQANGIVDGFRSILRGPSPLSGVTRGWAPTFLGYSAQGAFKFGFYEYFKYSYATLAGAEFMEKYDTFVFLAASASAEFFADIALAPMEAIKVRMQTVDGFATSLTRGFPKMMAEGGNPFYKGLVPLWSRQIPYTMMKFACFEETVNAIYKYAMTKDKSEYGKGTQLLVTFAAGYWAGIFCALVSHPADTVVSKMNQQGGTFMGIAKELGFGGLWKGLGARIIMIGTLTALQWFIYDSYKVSVGLPTTGGKAKKPEDKK